MSGGPFPSRLILLELFFREFAPGAHAQLEGHFGGKRSPGTPRISPYKIVGGRLIITVDSFVSAYMDLTTLIPFAKDLLVDSGGAHTAYRLTIFGTEPSLTTLGISHFQIYTRYNVGE